MAKFDLYLDGKIAQSNIDSPVVIKDLKPDTEYDKYGLTYAGQETATGISFKTKVAPTTTTTTTKAPETTTTTTPKPTTTTTTTTTTKAVSKANPSNVTVEAGSVVNVQLDPAINNGGTFKVTDEKIAKADYKSGGKYEVSGLVEGDTELSVHDDTNVYQDVKVPIKVNPKPTTTTTTTPKPTTTTTTTKAPETTTTTTAAPEEPAE